jgi:hypothetical protein
MNVHHAAQFIFNIQNAEIIYCVKLLLKLAHSFYIKEYKIVLPSTIKYIRSVSEMVHSVRDIILVERMN